MARKQVALPRRVFKSGFKTLKLDLSDFKRAADPFGRLAQTQMPFALSRSMNDTVKATRNEIITATRQTQVLGKRKCLASASTWQTQVLGKRKRLANACARLQSELRPPGTEREVGDLAPIDCRDHKREGARPRCPWPA